MKSFIDLTRKLHNGIEVYPGTPLPVLERPYTVEKDGYCETALSIGSHVGTHMDAPFHMITGGKTLDDYPAWRFFGKGMVIDLSGFAENKSVGWEELTFWEKEHIRGCDYLLFDTGFDTDQNALKTFPVPSAELLSCAIHEGVRTVGIDRMSIDRMDTNDMALHRLLFSHDVLVIENLCRLSELRCKSFTIAALPLLFEKADGAPVRVMSYMD